MSGYITFRRVVAVQESRVHRCYAQVGRTMPHHAPTDYWAEWCAWHDDTTAGTRLEWCQPCDRYVQTCAHLDIDIDGLPDVDAMVELRGAGWTYRQIATRYGMDPRTVWNRVQSAPNRDAA